MRATGKPFTIDKKQVYEAYKAVKSKGGAAGEDGQTIEQFEADLKSNLYKIWNRMSSGTYFPPAGCAPSPFPKSLEDKGFWVCRRWLHNAPAPIPFRIPRKSCLSCAPNRAIVVPLRRQV